MVYLVRHRIEIGVNTYSVKYIEDSDSPDNSEKFNGTANKDKKD